MEKVSIDDLKEIDDRADIARTATRALGLSNVALNYYELDPGEVFSVGMHTHMNQEEVFVILEGTATFETTDEVVTVEAGEIIRFPPGEYQQGRNEHEDRVRAFGVGAPQTMGETRTPVECRECGAEYHEVTIGSEHFTLRCPDCGQSFEV